MSRGSKSKTESVHSALLTLHENEKMEELLGRRCASMATAVVQLFKALPHSPSSWNLQHTGVVCFVKDNSQRSYFIRLLDVKTESHIWEQEVYNQFEYHCPQPYFHTFSADGCQAGLNFANVQEAKAFRNVVEGKINQRSNRQEKNQRPLVAHERGALPPPPSKGFPAVAATDDQSPDIHASRSRPVMSFASSSDAKRGKKDKKSKKKGPKLSKADIGSPSGFKHVSHVGWDPNNLDPDLLKLLSSAGIDQAELNDEETSQLIYNIIEQSGGMEAVKNEVNRGAAPPPPPPPHGRQGPLPPVPGASSSARAPPPPRGRSGPLPPLPGQRGGPPPRAPSHVPHGGLPPPPPTGRGSLPPPPPQSRSSPLPPLPPSRSSPFQSASSHASPPPPPPPPAPPSGLHRPPAAPAHSTLGRGGPPPPPPPAPPMTSSDFPPPPAPSFLPPSPSTAPSGGGDDHGDGRGALLDQIRLGKKLRNVTESSDAPSPAPAEQEGIVGALMMVMQKRSKVIHSSDEDEEEVGDDEDDDDEWDE